MTIYRCPTCGTKDIIMENLKECINKHHYVGVVGHKTRRINDSKNINEVTYNVSLDENIYVGRTDWRYLIPADAILEGK